MTTSELKSYIDRILGNNIRLLLPSYWWKRAFGAVIDKVDEKVEKSDLKTINGESVLGEGDLRVGVKSVESVEALEKLDAQVGDMATVGVESLEVVSVGNLYTPGFDGFSRDWDKLTRINKIELGEPVKGDGVYASVVLCKNGETALDNSIQIASENGTLFIIHHYRDSDTSGVTTFISEREANELLKKDEYRLLFYYAYETLNAVEVADKIVKLIIDHSSADAYIKSDSWEKLAKEHVVSSEGELNALDAPIGTIAKVGGDALRVISIGSLGKISSLDAIVSEWDNLTRINKVETGEPYSEDGYILLWLHTKGEFGSDFLQIVSENGEYQCGHSYDGTYREISLEELNSLLKEKDYRALAGEGIDAEKCDRVFKLYTTSIFSDAYIKGETWTRLLKEGDVTGGGAEILELKFGEIEEEKENNIKVYNKIVEAFNSDEMNIPMVSVYGRLVTSMTISTIEGETIVNLNIIADYVSFKYFISLSLNKSGELALEGEFEYADCYYVANQSEMKLFTKCASAGILPSVLYIDPRQGIVIADTFSSTDNTIIFYFNLSTGRTKVVVSSETGEILSEEVIANATGGGSTQFRIWYSDELTPAQKEDNVKAYNALMNKEAFDFELLYIEEGEDYYSINKEVVTGFTCHLDSQKVHISILVAATDNGLMTEPLYLTSDGTFEFEAPPL